MNATLEELSGAVAGIVDAGLPSVVAVGHVGSGFVVDNGLVVTNAHNLRGDPVVTFAGGRTAEATIAGVDGEGDLAVLAVGTAGVPALEWSERAVRLGEVVVGLSRPAGAARASSGFVTGLAVTFRGPGGRLLRGAIEHGAPLSHGSSGGPLLGASGRVVGVNTHRVGEGFYLALPASPELRSRITALSKGEEPRRARLGVALAPTKVARHLRRAVGLPERDGVLVRALEEDGPAARAGVRAGDLIVSVTPEGGESRGVTTVDELAAGLEAAGDPATATVRLAVVRGAEELILTVEFSRT